MGILSKFKRKKEELPPLPQELVKPEVESEAPGVGNIRAKMELVLTHLDSLRTQYDVLNERIKNIEKMVRELHAMAKT